ncbi:hypothetical protein VaNZ11_007609 [Volvox africanus]|uniref:CobW C-terminal domain-containing protein n=1 Tax=Volvox africanus TaxID=51714 RepID=A0ABQ5S382_9CHLO|nr:hypothetical protein VaNZ11_007609 [Volvox africanus]
MDLADIAALKKQAGEAFGDGDMHLCISSTKQAIGLLSKALRDVPAAQRGAMTRELSCLHSNVAAALLELGNHQSSAEEARIAIELDPSWHRPYLRLCIALTAMHGTSTEAAAAALCRGLETCQDPMQLRELQNALSTLQSPSKTQRDHVGQERQAESVYGKRGPDPRITISKYQRPNASDPDGATHPAKCSMQTPAVTPAVAIRQQAITHNEGMDTNRAVTPGQPAAGAAVPSTSPAFTSEAAAGFGTPMWQQQQQQPLQKQQQQQQQEEVHVDQLYPNRTPEQQQQQDEPQQHKSPLPVTALCGFLGSGKTTLVRHLLSSLESNAISRVGLLVNDLAPLNIDARLLRSPPVSLVTTTAPAAAPAPAAPALAPALAPAPAPAPGGDDGAEVGATACFPPGPAVGELLELSNGCVCCNLREELQQQLRQLAARQPPLEHLIVECTGVGEPAALAAAMRALAADGLELSNLVTVVDVAAFLDLMSGREEYGQRRRHGQRGGNGCEMLRVVKPPPPPLPAADTDVAMSVAEAEVMVGGAPRRPFVHLLMQQIETADIVILNKCDRLLERAQRRQQQQETVAADIALTGGGVPSREYSQPVAASGPPLELEAVARGELRRARDIVQALNPSARVLTAVRCAVPWEVIMGVRSPPLPPPTAQALTAIPPPPAPSSPLVGKATIALETVEIHEAQRPALVTGLAAAVGDQPGAGDAASMTVLTSPPPPKPPPPPAASGSNVLSGAMPTSIIPVPASIEPSLEHREVTAVTNARNDERSWTGRAHEEDEYGIGSFVFRSRVPFHPARLWALLQAMASTDFSGVDGGKTASAVEKGVVTTHGTLGEGGAGQLVVLPYHPPPLLRAKGFFWIASLGQAIWELSLAGGQVEAEAVGRWLCTMVDQEHWPVGHSHPQNTRTGPAATTGAAHDMDTKAAAEDEVEGGVAATAKRDGVSARIRLDGGDGADGAEGGEEGNEDSEDEAECIGEFVTADEGAARQRWHRRWGDRRNELVLIGVGLGESVGLGGTGQLMKQQLRELLRWAQLSEWELEASEEVWAAWDDANWLGLLEQY